MANMLRLDLNLLTALDALLETASVSRAAERIGLSQPAMSHALARLRADFDDPLLVRNGGRMERTPRAEALRAPLAEALASVAALYRPEHFDPATSTRSFRAIIPDVIAAPLLPSLAVLLAAEAPGCRLELLPWRGHWPGEEVLRTIDVAITQEQRAFPGFRLEPLYDDHDILVFRAGHPALAAPLTQDVFLALPQVAVIPADAPSDPVDVWLAELGLERRIALVVPHYLQALHLVARTALCAVLPARLTGENAALLGVEMRELPIDPGIDRQWLFYPARAAADPGSIWLRALIKKAARP